MKSHLCSKVLYINYLGRVEFIKTIINSIACKFLNYCSSLHLHNNENQVVIFAFDFIGHQINLKGLYERQELICTFKFLSEHNLISGVAVDVGANIGNHSLFFSKYYSKVYSFEPNLRTYKVLRLNVELADNITCFNIGLSDHERLAYLIINEGNQGGSHISENESIRNHPQQEIQLKTLDSFFDLFDEKLGLLKIDVEGHELAVLKGATNILERNKPIILFEQQKENFKNGESPVYEYLKSIGYTKFATVKAIPDVSAAFPQVIRNILVVVLRLILGLTYKVQLIKELPVDSYPFVIALPG